MVTVRVSDRAREWLEKAETEDSRRWRRKLEEITDFPEHYLDPLSGSPYYKLRVGDQRAIIDWDKEADVILVREIGKREGFY